MLPRPPAQAASRPPAAAAQRRASPPSSEALTPASDLFAAAPLQEYLPKLLQEQQEAADSSQQANALMQWAQDLSSRAQAALAGLQRSLQSFPAGEPTDDAVRCGAPAVCALQLCGLAWQAP